MKITSSLLNNLLWALILGCSLCLKFPANSSIFTSLFVNEHKPTSMSVYCVPLLAEESVFQRLSIKSQCQYKEHMFSPERKCFLFAFPFGIYNEEQHVLRWVFPVGISSQSFLPALPLPATFSPAALWKAFLSDWKTVFFLRMVSMRVNWRWKLFIYPMFKIGLFGSEHPLFIEVVPKHYRKLKSSWIRHFI